MHSEVNVNSVSTTTTKLVELFSPWRGWCDRTDVSSPLFSLFFAGVAASADASGRPLLYLEGAVHSNNFNPDWNGTVWKLTFFFAKH